MADLKATTAPKFTSSGPATADEDCIRKGEHDADIATRPTTAEVEALITAETHGPVTVPATNQTLALALDEQALTGEVIIPDDVEVQAAGTGLTMVFDHPVAAGGSLDLEREIVSSVVLIRRPAGGGTTIATGVAGTDYYLDGRLGIVHILTGSNLITASGAQEVYATYNCAQINSGPALESTVDGLAAKIGTTRDTAAAGDHHHTNDHPALSALSSTTVTLAVQANQQLTASARVKSGGGVTSDSDGLKIDTAVVPAIDHTHDDATESVAGFMSAADKTKLNTLEDVTVADTATVDLTITAGQITADVRLKTGGGVTSDADGLKVDPAVVPAIDHTHDEASGSAAGFMSIADFTKLAALASPTVADTDTLDLILTGSEFSGNVRLGNGLTSDSNGVKIDTSVVSVIGHTHSNATNSTAGFASAAQITMLEDHEARIDAIEESEAEDLQTTVEALAETTSIAASDMLMLLQNPETTPALKQITCENLFKLLATQVKGAHNTSDTYLPGHMVTDSGSLYMAKVEHSNQAVSNTTYWWKLAQAGTNGTNGANAYLYIAWADDDIGTGFSTSVEKNFIAFKNSTTVIASPSAGDFTGLWFEYKGEPGDDDPTLGGDLSGTASAATVNKIGGVTVSAFILTLVDDANAAAARTTLGLDTLATQAASAVAITGGTITGITDLALADGGTGASDATGARTNLGLGTMATQAASAVAITGGTVAGITDLAVADGGTGASTAANARTNLAAAGSGAVGSSGLTMSTARLLGRTTASTGAIEEITVGAGLTFSAGALSATAGSETDPVVGAITGIVMADGAGNISAAVAGTDYVATETDPIVGAVTGLVKADGAGAISAAAAGTDYLAPDGDGSGLTGVVTAETDPIVGAITGLVKADGAGAISAATPGTDYVDTELDPVVGAVNGIVKADGAGAISAAAAGTDYLAPDPTADGTYSFGGGGSGDVATITVLNGLITAVTLVP
jgi:hypothetical protein